MADARSDIIRAESWEEQARDLRRIASTGPVSCGSAEAVDWLHDEAQKCDDLAKRYRERAARQPNSRSTT